MAYGAEQYADATKALTDRGLRTEFTQTGGMCAALVTPLEAGYYLLVTDRDDTLSWERAEHVGWYVGLYRDSEQGGNEPERWLVSDDSTVQGLLDLVDQVLGAADRYDA